MSITLSDLREKVFQATSNLLDANGMEETQDTDSRHRFARIKDMLDACITLDSIVNQQNDQVTIVGRAAP